MNKETQNKVLTDQEIAELFSITSGKDFLKREPPLTEEEYNYYMSL